MSQFVQALRSFRNGDTSREDLLSEVDRQLTERRAAAGTLLAILAKEQASTALPTDVHDAITRKISGWLQDHTIMRPATTPPVQLRPDSDAPATILLNLAAAEGAERTQHSAVHRAPSVDVGSILQGRFKLTELVGEGGMSRVYKAIDLRRVEARSQDPYIAVKVLTVTFSDYFGSIATLHRETHKLQSLTHPNIVRVIDCDRDAQTVFMTMEFLAGVSLHRKLQLGIGSEQAVEMVVAIANALEFAHHKRIVHGDLKPGNVIITDSGDTKVIDFGIARFLARPKDGQKEEATGENEPWEVLNALTPPYASPEMLEDEQPDPRDDVYGLACIAYEILTGRHPFERAAATVARDSAMKPPRREGMSGRQFKAVLGGLQFDRDKRTPTAQGFIDDFCGTRSRKPAQIAAMAGVVALALAGLYVIRESADRQGAREAAASALTAGTVFRDCPTCPLMHVVPAGRFQQGATDGEVFEQPQHEVTIAYPLAVGQRELTIGEFEEFMAEAGHEVHGCTVYDDGEWHYRADLGWETVDGAQTALHPVSCVSWSDAIAYAQWLSNKTGQRYRLPSASEWEYAARAGAVSRQPWNLEADVCSIANVADQRAAQRYPGWEVQACDDNYAGAAPVGRFRANAFGLQDMIGNVFEWVEDCWHPDYSGAPTDGSARAETSCAEREMRGGSWFTVPAYVSLTYRNHFVENYRSNSVGFRVVREIEPRTTPNDVEGSNDR
jgi:formylglycine-generating enzyme required for sulfatase activity/predicted Ser/Thr protein kinase